MFSPVFFYHWGVFYCLRLGRLFSMICLTWVWKQHTCVMCIPLFQADSIHSFPMFSGLLVHNNYAWYEQQRNGWIVANRIRRWDTFMYTNTHVRCWKKKLRMSRVKGDDIGAVKWEFSSIYPLQDQHSLWKMTFPKGKYIIFQPPFFRGRWYDKLWGSIPCKQLRTLLAGKMLNCRKKQKYVVPIQ